jgi:hypothetical protein
VITITISTWPSHPRRVAYFRRTVEALRRHLIEPPDAFSWMVSAESARPTDCPWAGDELEGACKAYGLPLRWRAGPACLPAHINELFRDAFRLSDILFYVQDDYELTRAVPLNGFVRVLRQTRNLAGVRLWANTAYRGEAPVPGFADINTAANWSYADNPALWHIRWWERCGPFDTALDMAGHFASHEHTGSDALARSGMACWAPAEVRRNPSFYFDHIGKVTSVPNDKRWPDAPKRSDPALWQEG